MPIVLPRAEDFVRFNDGPAGEGLRLVTTPAPKSGGVSTTLFLYSDDDAWEAIFPPGASTAGPWHTFTLPPWIPAEATGVSLVALLAISNGTPADVGNFAMSFAAPNSSQGYLWQVISNAFSGFGFRTFGNAIVPVINRQFRWMWWKSVNYTVRPAGPPNWPQSPSMGVSIWCDGYYIPRHLNTAQAP